ncbi:hypothetical protein AKJ57_02045 [candidate division MSBL1 archaeon SCGC-AAA259A05]|uniref:Ribonuclease VapC n=1 Tax=candidate division MSBL1 archaeon SCGC-AAA259A05 TaxID=1698259 RepID=A0A133UAG7_9EURY|nr:hypothetical protein AKJ57_02045 [candidate division MSBL1 archaeon SCGC-AAA259A05]
MVLVDTTFIIDVMKRVPEAIDKAEELERSSEETRIPTPVIFELCEGIERSDHPIEKWEKVMRVLASFLEAPLNSKHAREAGRKSGRLIREGKALDPINVLIGGMATAEGEFLVTRDGDFERIPGVKVEGY